MPKTIRQAMSDRIRALPALRQFLNDFELSTGLRVEFVGSLGDREQPAGKPPLCRFLQDSPGGCRKCMGTVQELLEKSGGAPREIQCEVGLRESAVPLRAGGQVFGYFLVGGYFTAPPCLQEKNGIRHRLERLNIPVTAAAVDELCGASPVVSPARHDALVRILSLAAEHLTLVITDNLVQPTEKLPPLVRAACEQARLNFRHEISLGAIARQLGATTAHLCRIFHQSTGLRFREYVGRLRAERAREQLEATELPVTEIAFAAGFQSLSQFNRTFRSIYGHSPRDMRRDRPGRAGAPGKPLRKAGNHGGTNRRHGNPSKNVVSPKIAKDTV